MTAGPDVRCATCGNEFRPTRRGGGGVCPQCGDVAGPDPAAGPGACPQCGGPVPAGAAACGACGELLGGFGTAADRGHVGGDGPASLTLGPIWRAAWADWKAHLGTLLAGVLLSFVTAMVLTTAVWVGGSVILYAAAAAAAVGGAANGPPERWFVPILLGGISAGWLASLAVGSWMLSGLTRLHLDAARAGTADVPRGPELGRLFAGPGFGRVFLAGATVGTFVAILVYAPGLVMLGGLAWAGGAKGGGGLLEASALLLFYLLPAATMTVAFVLFWPVPFVAVDRPDLRHVRPVLACFTLPAGRWGSHVAVGLAAAGLLFLGWTTLCVGLLFTGPLAGLLLAHGYDRLTRSESGGPLTLDG